MAISKYNSEGYYDPTAYEALSKVEAEERKARYRHLVYICSPYSGNVEFNVTNARIYCRYALNNNCIPIAPHLLFPQFMNDEKPDDRELAMFMNMVLLSSVMSFGYLVMLYPKVWDRKLKRLKREK